MAADKPKQDAPTDAKVDDSKNDEAKKDEVVKKVPLTLKQGPFLPCCWSPTLYALKRSECQT